jgi:hypothetical protein
LDMPSMTKKLPGLAQRRTSSACRPIKVADAKGRVLLGPKVAYQQVQVEESGVGEWTIRLVEPVPVKEAWLFKNPEALQRVQKGFQQAQKREFAPDPREGRDYSWLDDVDEGNV